MAQTQPDGADEIDVDDLTEMEFAEAFPKAKAVNHTEHVDREAGDHETVDVSFSMSDPEHCAGAYEHQIPPGWAFDSVTTHLDTDTLLLGLIRWDDAEGGD